MECSLFSRYILEDLATLQVLPTRPYTLINSKCLHLLFPSLSLLYLPLTCMSTWLIHYPFLPATESRGNRLPSWMFISNKRIAADEIEREREEAMWATQSRLFFFFFDIASIRVFFFSVLFCLPISVDPALIKRDRAYNKELRSLVELSVLITVFTNDGRRVIVDCLLLLCCSLCFVMSLEVFISDRKEGFRII